MLTTYQVTVSGFSSGATTIYPLLTNEESRSYFRRAWLSGGSSKFDGDKSKTFDDNAKAFLRFVSSSMFLARRHQLEREYVDSLH